MSKEHLITEARRLFMLYKTYDEIAELLPVSKTTICDWSNKHRWKEQREERERSPENISQDLQGKLAANIKLLKESEDGTYKIDGDNILKIAQAIDKLGGVTNPLAIATIDMDRFSKFVKSKEGVWSPEKIKYVTEAIPEYLDQLGEEAY
jgi:transposase